MKKLSSFVLAAVLFVSTFLFVTPNASAQTATNKVVIFVDGNFQGVSQQLGVGSYDYTALSSGPVGNDKLSSLKVPPGYKVTLYEHNFSGRSKTFTSDATLVGTDFNDITSSIKVEAVPSSTTTKPQPSSTTTKPQPSSTTTKPQPSSTTTKPQPTSIDSSSGTISTEPGKTTKVQVTVDVPTDIGYDNTFGIFKINDDGSVAGVKPGAANYAETVVKNRISLPDVDQGSYKKGQTFKYELPGGSKYGVFLVANGTPNEFLQKNPTNQGTEPPLVYFFNTAANPDQKSHVKVSSDKPNQYGFEDMYGGGDQDFDDLIVTLETISG